MSEIHDNIKTKLAKAGIGYESIHVFGVLRCNVHIRCLSRDTADKWATLLGQVFRGTKISVTRSYWDAKENNGTCLLSTKRKGYLICVAA